MELAEPVGPLVRADDGSSVYRIMHDSYMAAVQHAYPGGSRAGGNGGGSGGGSPAGHSGGSGGGIAVAGSVLAGVGLAGEGVGSWLGPGHVDPESLGLIGGSGALVGSFGPHSQHPSLSYAAALTSGGSSGAAHVVVGMAGGPAGPRSASQHLEGPQGQAEAEGLARRTEEPSFAGYLPLGGFASPRHASQALLNG